MTIQIDNEEYIKKKANEQKPQQLSPVTDRKQVKSEHRLSQRMTSNTFLIADAPEKDNMQRSRTPVVNKQSEIGRTDLEVGFEGGSSDESLQGDFNENSQFFTKHIFNSAASLVLRCNKEDDEIYSKYKGQLETCMDVMFHIKSKLFSNVYFDRVLSET